MLDLILLLVVRLHLVGVVLGLGSDVGRVVSTVGHEATLHGEVHDVGADLRSAGRVSASSSAGRERGTHGIHEILRVGGDDEDVVVGGKVRLEPDDSLQIWEQADESVGSSPQSQSEQRTEMVGRLIEEKEMGADSESLGEGDTHPPSSRHVLGRLGHHLGSETETVQNGTGLGLEGRGVELLELLVLELESEVVHDVGNRHLLDLLLNAGGLVAGGLHDVVESGDVGRLDLSLDEVDLREKAGLSWERR